VSVPTAFNTGDTAWLLTCAALVLFMTPGLALFYAGMVCSRNALTMMQQNIVPMGVVGVLWALLGYSIAFSQNVAGFIGDLDQFGLRHLGAAHLVAAGISVPALAFVVYQMMFAIITPALITGATADRLKIGGWIGFVVLWTLIVYSPIVHWLWAPGGWLATLGAQDWAGGMVVHASAGAAVLAMLLVVGRRRNWPRGQTLPHSVPLTIAGAGILWFGWFGFNAGDGLAANGIAAQAFTNTQLAAAAAMLLWLVMERGRDGHATVLGAVTGAVAGLVIITPCAGYVSSYSALLIGAIGGLACHFALKIKTTLRLDDALDVVAIHLVGGVLGVLLLGFFGERAINSAGANGVFHGGGFGLLGHQVVALVCVVAFSFTLSWLIAMAMAKTIGLRADPRDEFRLDEVQQGMDAYHVDHVWNLSSSAGPARPAAAAPGAPARVAGASRLVTALIDPYAVDSQEMASALLRAGASSIDLSQVHHFSGGAEQVVRGQRRFIDFPDRLRVDVLVPEAQLGAVLTELRSFSSADHGGRTEVINPQTIIVGDGAG
jgi:ammonium transporter